MRHIRKGGNSRGNVINERFLKLMKPPQIQHHTIKPFQIQCFAMKWIHLEFCIHKSSLIL